MSLIKILIYSTDAGKEPYSIWENKLNKTTQAIVKNRLDRIKIGNLGDIRRVKGSKQLWEIKIDYGPGYRIYFVKKGFIMALLLGGEKKTQTRDIEKAKKYLLNCEDLL
ncbi:hypothetical protein A3F66_01845 [candidate division TM6 bacterium RIFCSPHIGHO2_12_FULL_32_22]|nr:MAG: hypothetical protein A3F66_01845 [candidate division TM6 bacterium RIFCSPHIGHO2_12_FULL_32_22]